MTTALFTSLSASTKATLDLATGRKDPLLTAAIALLLYSVLRPTWYWVSPIIARVSDLSVLLLALVLAAMMWDKSERLLRFMIPYVAYWVTMLISLALFAARGGTFVGADFVEFARPLFWMAGIAIGYGIVRRAPNTAFRNLTLALVIIGWINSIIAWLMYIIPDFSLPLFQMYSVHNLYDHGRPGGLAYTHTEYVAINVMGVAASIIENKKLSFVTIVFLLVSCIVPQSKAGLVMIFVMASVYSVIKLRIRIVVLCSLILMAGLVISWPILGKYLQSEFPYIYYGFSTLLRLPFDGSALRDGSIGPRALDWMITWERMVSDPLIAMFGNSPMRGYREISYIENTATNVLFRFGIIGLICYYFNFIIVSLSENIDKATVISFIVSIIVADCAANFSESIKFMFCLAVLFGALFARSAHNREREAVGKEDVSAGSAQSL